MDVGRGNLSPVIETIVLGVNQLEERRMEAFPEAVADVADPTHATLQHVRVLTPAEYQQDAERFGYDGQPGPKQIVRRLSEIRRTRQLSSIRSGRRAFPSTAESVSPSHAS